MLEYNLVAMLVVLLGVPSQFPSMFSIYVDADLYFCVTCFIYGGTAELFVAAMSLF